MPIYQYRCDACAAVAELRRAIEERDDLASCPCGYVMRRVFSPSYTNMGGALSDDPITRWQFAHLDDKTWSKPRWV